VNSTVRIIYGFFCEHLRQEASGQTTAIGLWGTEWRIATAGPVTAPSLSFHAFVTNPKQIPISGNATFQLPGVDQKIEIPLNIQIAEGMTGHNINLTIGNVPIAKPGQATVRLQFNCEPPIDEEFSLEIRFIPPPNGPSPKIQENNLPG